MCGLEAAIAGTTVPQKKGAGASIQPVQTSPASALLYQFQLARRPASVFPSLNPAGDKSRTWARYILAAHLQHSASYRIPIEEVSLDRGLSVIVGGTPQRAGVRCTHTTFCISRAARG